MVDPYRRQVTTGSLRRSPIPRSHRRDNLTLLGCGGRSRPSALGAIAPAAQLPACSTDQLQVGGAFNECARNAHDATQYCTVSGTTLSNVIVLQGAQHRYLLYLSIDGGYKGSGDYHLAPWSSSLGVNDGKAKVAVREYATGAFWQSVSGTLHVSGDDGRSGDVAVNLTFTGGAPSPADFSLGILGPWTCS